MTAPTDALRAECERALREWWISPDASKAIPIPGLGPPRMVEAAFRAGFNVLAAEIAALRAGREEDARLRLFVEAIRDTTTMPGEATLRAAARAVLANRPEGE